MNDKTKKIFKEILTYVVIIIVVILIKAFLFSFIRVNGQSMIDTLEDKDIMILNKLNYKVHNIKRFDIVVIKYEDEYIIKRVIGLPGETVEYKNNTLYINGKVVDESFSHKDTENFKLEDIKEKKVLEDEYFVLGDNRTNSLDSRIIGLIPRKKIIGKANFTLFPFSRFGNKN